MDGPFQVGLIFVDIYSLGQSWALHLVIILFLPSDVNAVVNATVAPMVIEQGRRYCQHNVLTLVLILTLTLTIKP